ncbi:hypothetical protein ACTFIU_002585 [Dictyostelium citrinum]
MRLLKNLILMVVLFVTVSNATTKFTFNTFTVRNTEDQSCFTKTAKTVEDSTKVDINKCTVGCGGSMKIRKGTKSQQYQFELFSSQDCTGETTSKVLFICPNPSIESIPIKSTSNTIKCGTLPPDAEVNEDDTATAVVNDDNNTTETETKTKSTPKSPSTSNTHNSNEVSDLSTASNDSSSTKSSPKSKSSTETNDETDNKPKSDNEAANGNSASSTIATFSLVIISLLVASLL